MYRLHIPNYVYPCCTKDGVVLLDARHNRYFALGGQRASRLARLVENWPETATAHAADAPLPELEWVKMSRLLLQRKLLVRNADPEAPQTRMSVPPVTVNVPRQAENPGRFPATPDWVNFGSACTTAAWNLKWRSLEHIAQEVTEARARRACAHASADGGALEKAQLFCSIRRFFFSEKNRCLFSALSLVYFLRHYGYFPLWVIGVRTAPFTAHSWVQEGSMALDGDPTVICHYVPILAA